MRINRLLILALCCVTVCGVVSGNQAASSATQGPPHAVELNRGTLQLRKGGTPVISNMRLRLRFADGSSVTGEFERAGDSAGMDAAGRFERQSFSLKMSAPLQGASQPSFKASLELRRYLQPEVWLAWLDYDGPALAATDGIQLLMGLDRFARGMAHKRFKLYWTAPVFVSDHRFLGRSNQLLLWQQYQTDGYQLLVPLAGDGMVAELGVAEINYRYEFRVSSSSYDPKYAPRRVPLFAYAAAAEPYRLPRDAYQTAFAATGQYGRLRWQKSYPEIFRSLGWCSWNAYEHAVTEEKITNSVRAFRDKGVPLGFVLVDDGWLSVKNDRLTAYGADAAKFPRGLAGLAATLRNEYRIPHVGVWHTFQGYWSGVDGESEIGRAHQLFTGIDGKALPDPRDGRGESFYSDWYRSLKEWGYDFVKVDGQANNIRFTDGLMPLFTSGGGSQRNLQEAAGKYFAAKSSRDPQGQPALGLINCMEMTLENAFNWRDSNLARNSDDYLPDVPQNFKDHVYQNAYNSFWTSNFAYPDWDMFQSHDPHADFHAAARAISGGPIYVTDEAGKERVEVLRPLALSNGQLLMLDSPGQVTRDLLMTDPALEPVPLKVFGRITRPGLKAGMVAAFNVNKTAERVAGTLRAADVEGLLASPATTVAVYRRGDESTSLLGVNDSMPVDLKHDGFDIFTLSPVAGGVAVFGLLDKYLGPAAVVSQNQNRQRVEVRLVEAGEFGAWMERAPLKVELDGRSLPASAYSYRDYLLRVPASSFGNSGGEHVLRIYPAPRSR